ncbi:Mg2+ transporter protein CorA-like/Zinc transport protein ZntB [Penicillium malachiteum]|nr:Mg2+ transporter protein CorA-like/Zinc transport protein ZntB [Penicillium malachiteum]
MLKAITSEHRINSLFWQLPLCFFDRLGEGLDLEGGFCVPYTETRTGSVIEISYTIRYPEYKPKAQRWDIRQTGLYHKYDFTTGQSTYILINPNPRSKAFTKIEEWLFNPYSEIQDNPFWLHAMLFSTYYPACRSRIMDLEREFLPLSDSAFAAFIDEPLSLKYHNLNTLTKLESHFLQLPTILAGAIDVLDELCTLLRTTPSLSSPSYVLQDLRNQHRQCVAYCRTSKHIQQRIQSIARLLADTLLLRDQVVASEQNKNMLQLNESAVFITRLSLLYLPPSFIATFFGMNFFAMDQNNSTIVGTSMLWIFFIVSAVLTAFTFLIYYCLLHRNSPMVRRLIQGLPQINIQSMKQRFRIRQRSGMELEHFPA